MEIRRRPKLIAALLIGGTIVLVGGGAAAATLPGASARMMNMAELAGRAQASQPGVAKPIAASPAPSASDGSMPVARPSEGPSPSVTAQAEPKAALQSPAGSTVTYVVQPGDTLSGIAQWFKLHGYGALYAANAARIGADPNLILPGERITISGGVMTVAGP